MSFWSKDQLHLKHAALANDFSLCLVPLTSSHVYPSSRDYYRKSFARRFKKDLRGGQHFQPPWLIPQINQDGHFLFTEAVENNCLTKSIYEANILSQSPPKIVYFGGGRLVITVSVNLFSDAVHYKARLSKSWPSRQPM